MARDRSREMVRQLAPVREPSTSLSIDELAEVIALMRGNDIEEIHIEREGDADTPAMMLHLIRPATTVVELAPIEDEVAVAADAAPDAAAESPADEHLQVVRAQLVGAFHVGAKPGARTSFAPNEKVKQGQTLGTIETLGSFIEVEAPISGTIAASYVAEGDTVEYGQQLLTIAPDDADESDTAGAP